MTGSDRTSGVPRRVLGIDSALAGCSAAVLVDGALVARCAVPMTRGHAERLLPMVREVMIEAGLGFEALDLIAVTVGPGHFTGLRIGLAAAQGMALAWRLPLAGVTTLEAIAAGVPGRTSPLVVTVETKRDDLYIQVFLDGQAEASAVADTPDRLADRPWPRGPISLAGDGAARLGPVLRRLGHEVRRVEVDLPDAADVARLAAARHGTSAARRAEPLYLRPPDVTVPKVTGR